MPSKFSLKTLAKAAAGSEAEGDIKQDLVLLPGFLCDETVWLEQAKRISDIVRCFCAEWGDLDSITDMAEAVLRAAPEKFSLAGHSMGGRVAFEVYRMEPGRVTRLALMDTGPRPRPSGAAGEIEERRRLELLQLARSRGMRAMAMQWLPPMIHPERMRDTGLVEAIVRMVERKTPDHFESQMHALLGRPDATGVLASIRCPTLVLVGADDAWSPPESHEEMAAAIPDSRLVLIPQCGHMSTMEQPEAVAEAMRAWLQTPHRGEKPAP